MKNLNYQVGIGSGIGGELGLSGKDDREDPVKNMMNESEEGEYVPNEKEIHGYAEFLGMDPEKDKEFLYIAVEGLKAPVPAPWETYYDDNDEIFYVNPVTGQKMYDHPLDEEYRQKFLRLKAEKEGNAQYANNQMDSYAA